MGSQFLEIVRQGVWASLTGGWFFDPRQGHAANILHLYLWLLLLALPFCLYMFADTVRIMWAIYITLVTVLFTSLKILNVRLHRLFDTGEAVQEPEEPSNGERVELQLLPPRPDGETPPVQCSSRNSLSLANRVDSIEFISHRDTNSVDLAVQLARRSSGASSVGSRRSVGANRGAGGTQSMRSTLSPESQRKIQQQETASTSGVTTSLTDEPSHGTHSGDTALSSSTSLQQPPAGGNCPVGQFTTFSQTTSADPLMKITGSVELGFISQDPSVARARTQTAGTSPRKLCEDRQPVRRAHSEMETSSQKDGDKKISPGVPPSHPVSLEAISSQPPPPGAIPRRSMDHIRRGLSEVTIQEDDTAGAIPIPSHKDLMPLSAGEREGVQPKKRKQRRKKKCSSDSGTEEATTTDDSSTDTHSERSSTNFSVIFNPKEGHEQKDEFQKGGPLRSKTEDAMSTATASGEDKHAKDQQGSFEWSFPPNEDDARSSSSSTSSPDETTPSLKPSESSRHSSQGTKESQGMTAWQRGQILRLWEILNKKDDDVSSRDVRKLKEALRVFGTFDNYEERESSGSRASPASGSSRKDSGKDLDSRKSSGTGTETAKSEPDASTSYAPDVVACATAALSVSTAGPAAGAGSAVTAATAVTPSAAAGPTTAHGAMAASTVADVEDDFSPPSYLLASMLSTPGTHLARSHDDTSPGAVHCFRDEEANWQAYTFNESGRASSPVTYVAYLNSRHAMQARRPRLKVTDRVSQVVVESEHGPWDAVSQASSSSGATLMVAGPSSERTAQPETTETVPSMMFQRSLSSTRDTRHHRPRHCEYNLRLHSHSLPPPSASRFLFGDIGPMEIEIGAPSSLSYPYGRIDTRDDVPRARQYYMFKLLPWKTVKVAFDRLTLMAVLDRNVTLCENLFSVVLAVLVAILGSWCLREGLFVDLSSFIFCFVIASCQYSLLKSVQPDAASPTHGYNHLVLYSRPVYFCLCCIALLISKGVLESDISYPDVSVYNWKLCTPEGVISIKNFLIVFVLCFPLIFSFGLLPQVNTFLTYLCEQLDMHIFGGTAATGPMSALYCLGRSLLVTGVLYTLCYTALMENRNPANNITFSIFCGVLVTSSYHLSRSQSDPTVLLQLIRSLMSNKKEQPAQVAPSEPKVEDHPQVLRDEQERQQWKMQEFIDPLPQQMKDTVLARLKTDAIYVFLLTVFVFAIHVSTMFTVLQPYLQLALHSLAIIWGGLLHYFLPQMRKHLPWLCCSVPCLKSREHDVYESTEPAQLMWFEKVQVLMWFFEKNCLYPLVILSALTVSLASLLDQFGLPLACLVLVVCSMRCLRGGFTDPSKYFIALTFTILIFTYDLKEKYSEPLLVNFFVMLLVTNKVHELLLKLRFVITYIAPWQITWGSAFHAFAQPFSVPHSAMLFIQAIVSSALSAPLSPVLGSAIFFTSYVRPVKFWERDYNTKRVDHSNTCLSSQLERNPGSDDNNLNSIFYEHLTRSLQKSLYGDLALGRWGAVSQGDCFVLASDNLNCLVHIIEFGNGLVTFQLRGLEFRGTYCQQREVEAITEEVKDNLGCCCCEPGHLTGMLSVNAAFNQRWLAWEVSAAKYILEGYSISDNSAVPLLQLFEVRRALMTYYVKSVIFYTITNKKLEAWLENPNIQDALKTKLNKQYAELDPVFTPTNDADFDSRVTGISRNSFCNTYLPWIQYCVSRLGKHLTMPNDKNSSLVSLCFALSVLARRALGSASHNTLQSVDYLLFGLHALFKGDIRIASARDEWVFQDMDLLKKVVAPAVRMAFKLHQDHFMSSDELERSKELFDTIESYTNTLVISHEADPAWRNAVLSGVQSLLALRHVADENSDDYKIITLNKRFLDFRVIKVNRECVRGLWAGQQQELVYLRNRNPERGSIQNAKQALRNIINSSCDQPIGYPIYVSPLTTSFAETSPQLCSIIGGPLSLSVFKQSLFDFWRRLKIRCGEGCSSGGTGLQDEGCGGGYSAPASLSGSIARGVDPSVAAPPRRSHSSGSHLTNTDVATASVGGRTTTSASSSTIGAIGATSSSLGRNSTSYVRTSLGNLTVSSLTKPGSANVTVVSMRPFEETPFVIGESAGSRSTVFGTWDPQTGQLVATSSSSSAAQGPTGQHQHQSNVITSEMTKL